MNIVRDILAYDFLAYAFIACILSGITCGIIGSYVVARRIVFLSGGITHASFGGLGIALYAGFSPLLGALGFASISAVGIEYASRRIGIREDSATGIIWSIGMATGALFMSLRAGYATDLTSYLFGNILLVGRDDVVWLGVLTAVVILGSIVWLRRIMYITFDEEFARSQGVATTITAYVMSIVVSTTIVLSIKVMGIILLLSLISMPTVIVNMLTKDYRLIALWSAVIAVICNIIGFAFSYTFDLPTGSCIIFILTATLICVKLFTLCRRVRLKKV
ncbi:MAG: metal ABC transporter permease [Alistipes sp.]|nr:metal ABC transporter permease [Alistipes sp.]